MDAPTTPGCLLTDLLPVLAASVMKPHRATLLHFETGRVLSLDNADSLDDGDPLDDLRALLAASGHFKADPRLSRLVYTHFGPIPAKGGTAASPAGLASRPVRRPSGLLVPGSFGARPLEATSRPIIVRGVSALPRPQVSVPESLKRRLALAHPSIENEVPTLPSRTDTQRVLASRPVGRRRQPTFARAAALAAVLVLAALGTADRLWPGSDGLAGAPRPSPRSLEDREVARDALRPPTLHLVSQQTSVDQSPKTRSIAFEPHVIDHDAVPPVANVKLPARNEAEPASVIVLKASDPVPQPQPSASPQALTEAEHSAAKPEAPTIADRVAITGAAQPSVPSAKAAAMPVKRKASRKPTQRTVVASRWGGQAPNVGLPDILKPQ